MMQYDGDLEVPKNFLVAPPVIDHCLSEVLIEHGVRQFACSETQKFGHVTFFWNGNRSGYIDEKVELYQEIPSALGGFEKSPEMKAAEISNATIAAIQADQFDFGRINYANGDMVGHTGDFWATVKAVEFVDQEVGRLWAACEKAGVTLVVTADHGNADDMFQDKFDPQNQTHSSWVAEGYKQGTQKPKTSHSLSKVPFLWCDPRATTKKEALPKDAGIGQVAPTVLEYFGAKVPDFYARPIR